MGGRGEVPMGTLMYGTNPNGVVRTKVFSGVGPGVTFGMWIASQRFL